MEDKIQCWCGLTAVFHHRASIERRDGKKTVWYKCPDGHRVSADISWTSHIPQKESLKKGKKQIAKDIKSEDIGGTTFENKSGKL